MDSENEWDPWEDDNPQCPHCGEYYTDWRLKNEPAYSPNKNLVFTVICPHCCKTFEAMSACHIEFRTRKLT